MLRSEWKAKLKAQFLSWESQRNVLLSIHFLRLICVCLHLEVLFPSSWSVSALQDSKPILNSGNDSFSTLDLLPLGIQELQ